MRRSCPAAAIGAPRARARARPAGPAGGGAGPPCPAAEIGGGLSPRLAERPAEPRRAACEVSGGVTAASSPLRALLPWAWRLSDLCPVGCRGSWRQSPSWPRRRLPAAGSVSRDALATAREKFPHGRWAGGEAVPGWALAVGRRGPGGGSARFVCRRSGDPR